MYGINESFINYIGRNKQFDKQFSGVPQEIAIYLLLPMSKIQKYSCLPKEKDFFKIFIQSNCRIFVHK